MPDASVDVVWLPDGSVRVCGPEVEGWTFQPLDGTSGSRRSASGSGPDTPHRSSAPPWTRSGTSSVLVEDLLGADGRRLVEELGDLPDGTPPERRVEVIQEHIRRWVAAGDGRRPGRRPRRDVAGRRSGPAGRRSAARARPQRAAAAPTMHDRLRLRPGDAAAHPPAAAVPRARRRARGRTAGSPTSPRRRGMRTSSTSRGTPRRSPAPRRPAGRRPQGPDVYRSIHATGWPWRGGDG